MWITDKNKIPKSAKVMPIWITPGGSSVDLVYLTDDEKYYVSCDHKRVYKVEEIHAWTLVEQPSA